MTPTPNPESKRIVAEARQAWNVDAASAEYHQLTEDAAHLHALRDLHEFQPGKHYLDLGTGTGYLARDLAQHRPDIHVTGVDIADQAMSRLASPTVRNLQFVAYDGIRLPFADASFRGVATRYAFHHFPEPRTTVRELRRILEPGGSVIIADPITYAEDTENFIDRFQQVKPDGHVHFFRTGELDALFAEQGFTKQAQFFKTLTYPRDYNPACRAVCESTPEATLRKYRVALTGPTITVTVTINNVRFQATG